MHRSKVVICGVNTAKLKVLTNEEMQKLFIKIKDGDSLCVSGWGSGRVGGAVGEVYQQKDGSIKIPDALKKYFGDIEYIK